MINGHGAEHIVRATADECASLHSFQSALSLLCAE